MSKKHDKIQKIIKRTVNYVVEAEEYGWPPQCATFLYQPVRPQKSVESELLGAEKNNELLSMRIKG